MSISRRGFLRAGVGVGAAAAVGAAGWAVVPKIVRPGEPGLLLPSSVPLPQPFRARLPIPPELSPVASDATTDYYEIVQRTAHLDILQGLRTEAWTYHGSFPGPTIRARSGRATAVRHRNELPHPTVVHLHGGHTPADSDGYPMDLILPVGATTAHQHSHGHGAATMTGALAHGERTYVYPNRQRAATLWYHDHRHSFTGPAVWRGLAGFHLVGDDVEDALPLPQGDRDVPLLISDRSFAADGSFAYPLIDPELRTPGVTDPYMNGVLGDVVLVNGAPWPRLEVSPVRYRFRVLNASNARRYRLTLDPPGDGFVQIGSDGGLLDRPIRHDHIDISPAERFDVVIDFGAYPPGTSVRLRNTLDTGPAAEIMRFDVTGPLRRDDTTVPDRLAPVERLDPATAVAERTFLFQLGPHGWSINGAPYEPGRALANPRLGTVEIWRSITDFHHPVHVHLDPFQVISRNNRPPGPFDAGWKDTVDVRPAEAVEVAVRFTDYPGPFMLHCHNLEHEDMAMMADFMVT
ncbi:multicopper oxidase family protein [Nocardia cyriacigeorgica]|uniref:Multicopper oxidase CueO n=1 Tax=Nocardia cyriacigeorgica (strain GUH-2) TaxID=1127134 RepID=H6R9C4_NOCCG|nr:multicopper oxidase domain-containing protein [Nocardia cyriacigeorgica]BDT88543.1 spore coat protein A [Nocardia cyriacigeorgica]CCF64905.1 Spore coat protein (Outer) [Nocardia cyriacigeorgica GUH-2]